MDVLLVRHAMAVTAVGRLRDEDRWLTDTGRASAIRVGNRLRELGIRPTAMYTSPLVRAVQTTELLARTLGADRVEVHVPLAIDTGTVAQVVAVLERHASDDTVVLVTHEPKVRSIAAALARKDRFAGFNTAGSAFFRGARGGLRHLWSLDPESLVTLDAAGDDDG